MQLTRSPKQADTQVGGVPSVNLLPASVQAKRAQTRILRQWGVRLVAAVALVAVCSAGLFAWQTVTEMRVLAVQAEGNQLLTRISAEHEIGALMQQESDLAAFHDEAMATDVEWTLALASLKQHLPADAKLLGFDLKSGAQPEGAPDEQIGLTGTVTVGDNFATPVPLLRALEQVPGLTRIEGFTGESPDGPDRNFYLHNLSVTFDQTIYTSYEKPEGEE